MTITFVNGNPETGAVWGPLLDELPRQMRVDAVVMEPPGFGGALPPGWQSTVTEYEDWLVGELEGVSAPVHLVGHDWGGILTLLVAMNRPDLIASWVSDAAGVFDPGYRWHPAAASWQTDGEGERSVQQLLDLTLGERADVLTQQGMTPAYAQTAAASFGPSTAESILRLYRSAQQPFLADAGRNLDKAAARPGLVVVADQDTTVGTVQQREHAAARAGATTTHLDGASHWWLLHAPAEEARILQRFWATVPDPA